jgi:hypothetical protein
LTPNEVRPELSPALLFRLLQTEEYTTPMEIGLLIVFSAGSLWMYFTTSDQRQMALGYAIAFAVVMALLSLITGQGPNRHYGL